MRPRGHQRLNQGRQAAPSASVGCGVATARGLAARAPCTRCAGRQGAPCSCRRAQSPALQGASAASATPVPLECGGRETAARAAGWQGLLSAEWLTRIHRFASTHITASCPAVVGLAAEMFVCRRMTQQTGGTYSGERALVFGSTIPCPRAGRHQPARPASLLPARWPAIPLTGLASPWLT